MGGGGHGGSEPKTLMEKITSKDEYLVLSTYAGVATIVFLSKLFKSNKEEPKQEAAPAKSDGGIPSVDSPEFENWIAVEGNFEKLMSQMDSA
eukprot:CAMPEP_0197515326 /NCGR_PEP_ID=MMETSP1318-20131121/497_1 /TAXON_ID=552666 /ORGANISM="Partenskyella glossopodia, Strain RCC365" /LENGTH=91 /DNA_ID=CAMNT_0043063669 /DNA_START=124 /DNA_END=399 /DNA_ORIENTATION=+